MKLKDLIDEIEMFDEDEMTLFIAALANSVNRFDKAEFDRVYEEKQRLKQLAKTMSEIPTEAENKLIKIGEAMLKGEYPPKINLREIVTITQNLNPNTQIIDYIEANAEGIAILEKMMVEYMIPTYSKPFNPMADGIRFMGYTVIKKSEIKEPFRIVMKAKPLPTIDIPDFCLTEPNREGFEVRNG